MRTTNRLKCRKSFTSSSFVKTHSHRVLEDTHKHITGHLYLILPIHPQLYDIPTHPTGWRRRGLESQTFSPRYVYLHSNARRTDGRTKNNARTHACYPQSRMQRGERGKRFEFRDARYEDLASRFLSDTKAPPPCRSWCVFSESRQKDSKPRLDTKYEPKSIETSERE